jgi:hypothetical protein
LEKKNDGETTLQDEVVGKGVGGYTSLPHKITMGVEDYG